jgi:hypothetical protein
LSAYEIEEGVELLSKLALASIGLFTGLLVTLYLTSTLAARETETTRHGKDLSCRLIIPLLADDPCPLQGLG